MTVHAIGWCGFASNNPDRLCRILAEAFALQLVQKEPDIAVLMLPSGQTVKVYEPSAEPKALGDTMVGLLVDDLDVAVARAHAAGARILGNARSNGLGARWQHVALPDGPTIDLTYRPPDWLDAVRSQQRTRR